MIYFLVNNNYQFFDALSHVHSLREVNIGASLIAVPHKLDFEHSDPNFEDITLINSPLASHRWLRAWLMYFTLPFEIKGKLFPRSTDVLFFYTEYELANHFIVQYFKSFGARVYIIEDGGVGTYLPFSSPSKEPLSVKEKIQAIMTRCLPGLRSTEFHKVNGIVFPWLRNSCIDSICLYRPLKVIRSIPVIVIQRKKSAAIIPYKGRVIFLNERMYDDYQSSENYMIGLGKLLHSLSMGFSEVLFKFHPREEPYWIERVKKYLADSYANVKIIEEQQPIEKLISQYRPEVIASYFSTTLMNLDDTGIEPMFMYHLLDDLVDQPFFKQLTLLLTQWNYHFIRNLEDARSGYRSGMRDIAKSSQISITELLFVQK